MNKHYQNLRKQAGLLAAIGGSLLIGLPAGAMPRMQTESLVSQTNPSPSIFQEAPYNRTRREPISPVTPGATPTQPAAPGPVTQPPLPEERQAPSAMVMLMDGRLNIRLVNETGANISYQVIGDTDQRSLQGKSDVMLRDLSPPISVTFRREDGGLISVTTQPSEKGMLEARFTETTDLGMDRNTMRIQETGAVYLN